MHKIELLSARGIPSTLSEVIGLDYGREKRRFGTARYAYANVLRTPEIRATAVRLDATGNIAPFAVTPADTLIYLALHGDVDARSGNLPVELSRAHPVSEGNFVIAHPGKKFALDNGTKEEAYGLFLRLHTPARLSLAATHLSELLPLPQPETLEQHMQPTAVPL